MLGFCGSYPTGAVHWIRKTFPEIFHKHAHTYKRACTLITIYVLFATRYEFCFLSHDPHAFYSEIHFERNCVDWARLVCVLMKHILSHLVFEKIKFSLYFHASGNHKTALFLHIGDKCNYYFRSVLSTLVRGSGTKHNRCENPT